MTGERKWGNFYYLKGKVRDLWGGLNGPAFLKVFFSLFLGINNVPARKQRERSKAKQGKIHFGALVECQDIGVVKYIIDDPQTGHTTHLAIDKGNAHPKIVACNEIDWISNDNKVIRLGITTKQFDSLPDFLEEDYTCAPGPFGCPSQPFYHNQGPHTFMFIPFRLWAS